MCARSPEQKQVASELAFASGQARIEIDNIEAFQVELGLELRLSQVSSRRAHAATQTAKVVQLA